MTKRVSVEELENILYEPIKVLDHGFIRVIDYMGDDSAIVQAARVSYGKGTKQVNQDRGLINYLMRNSHTTPFEMCEIKFHIKLPIFVARQWIRHRTANVNEYSGRYSVLSKEFYIPKPENVGMQSSINKQGRADISKEAESFIKNLINDSETCYRHYLEMLNQNEDGSILDESRDGISRELARMNLPLNFYTEWYWKIDLHNLLHFTRLRADSHAQYEIRVYAEVIKNIIQKWVPLTFDAFEQYRVKGVNLSEKAMTVIQNMIKGNNVSFEDSGMSKRE